jgi:hypothetical protein
VGESQPPHDLLLLLRTPDIELLVTLDERDAQVNLAFGAGRTRIKHRRQQGSRPGPSGPARRERVSIDIPSLASLVIDALDHRGRCDRDWLPVFARARELAAALSSLAAVQGGEGPAAGDDGGDLPAATGSPTP